jgi:hypothetical protein
VGLIKFWATSAQVEVGTGQKRTTAINQKLEGLVSTQSVQAIFLNENYYYGNSKTIDYHGDSATAKTLRFLGYYEFFESRFVVGDHHDDIDKEFGNPSDKLWQFLTFRLHPHLQIKARPFISNIDEVHRLQKNSNSYHSVVVNEDDHGEIHYDNVTIGDWMNGNHTVSIENVIDWLIDSEQIKQYLVAINESEISTRNDREDTEHDNKDVTIFNNDQELSRGTSATISDIVHCCVFISASCAMRYNQNSLHHVNDGINAAPLQEHALGIILRTRPTPTPNRALDVNLCYLRHAFTEHKVLSPYINNGKRCDADIICSETLAEMMFQIILLRYTGRIY